MNRITIRFTFFLLFIAFGLAVQAQPNNPSNPVPLDGGLSLLLAGGAALGYKVYRKRNNNPE